MSEMLREPSHRLDFGAICLTGTDGPRAGYSLHALTDNTNWGTATAVMTVIDSLLGDGEIVTISRHNNREAAVGIKVTGSSGVALAEAEAALVAETEKQNELRWQAPDLHAPLTVFDVITSWLEHVFDDEDEMRLERRYILHLVLYPSSKSPEELVVEPLGAGVPPSGDPAVVEVVDTCSTTTGWTGRTGAGIDPIGIGTSGNLFIRGDVGWDLWLKFDTGAIQTWSDTPLLVVDWRVGGIQTNIPLPLRAYAAGVGAEVQLQYVSEGPSPFGSTFRRTTYALGSMADSTRYVKFYKTHHWSGPEGFSTWDLVLTNVQVTDGTAPVDGTTRQLFRSMMVQGSARAMGAIDIRHTDPLGDTLIWTGPSACSPPLRARRVSGGSVSTDATCVSGASEEITSPFTADAPLETLPAGNYLVVGRMWHESVAGTYLVDVTAQTRLTVTDPADTPVGNTVQINDARVSLGTSSDKRIVSLGTLHLPATETAAGAAGYVRVTCQAADVVLDELWLFNVTDGALTWVKDAGNIVQVIPPTLADPRRRVFTGPSDAALYDAGALVEARDEHLFQPGDWAAFTVTVGAEDAAMTATYFPRWHTHAGALDI